jgi:hypothetical protein
VEFDPGKTAQYFMPVQDAFTDIGAKLSDISFRKQYTADVLDFTIEGSIPLKTVNGSEDE